METGLELICVNSKAPGFRLALCHFSVTSHQFKVLFPSEIWIEGSFAWLHQRCSKKFFLPRKPCSYHQVPAAQLRPESTGPTGLQGSGRGSEGGRGGSQGLGRSCGSGSPGEKQPQDLSTLLHSCVHQTQFSLTPVIYVLDAVTTSLFDCKN